MSLLDETVEIPRRTMTLFFVIDTSGSMAGSKIGAVNDAVVNVLPMLEEISAENPDAELSRTAYSPKRKLLSPKQLQIIFSFLGEP